ncbi:uncharacterized protein J4E92_009921 [Alternaria infectoria]|uniref:uncharacterized protein n=1 Tax=Alternaria infectoria TaxID=45303 RepID=UPI00221EBF9D|nr:uncharacterized protein J4E92_009921 [Alternaria infectoria]KAI4913049.1 hypothetical protein J4E92_009921 [Alternaria infectoria]
MFLRMRSESYTYESLPMPSSIRILQIDPGAPSDPITCHFRIVNLDDRPSFTALSYSWQMDPSLATNVVYPLLLWRTIPVISLPYEWLTKILLGGDNGIDDVWQRFLQEVEGRWADYNKGKEGDEKPIFCDGKKIMIHANLYEAMVRLRCLRPTEYWIDAVCINQEDLSEKTQQVQMMGRIYGYAEEVVVWLGNVTSFAAYPFQTLFSVFGSELDERDTAPGYTTDDSEIRRDSEGVVTDEKLDAMAKEHHQERDLFELTLTSAAFALLTRRWFRRLWVVQESRQARQTLFLLGETQFRANLISSVLRWVEYKIKRSPISPTSDPLTCVSIWHSHIKHIPAMLSSMNSSHDEEKWTLQQWLQMAKSRKAGDAKDVVFAGLSLIRSEHLTIDTSLQARGRGFHCRNPKGREQMPSSEGQMKLWDMLHADYNAETSTVLLNLAACILSHYDLSTLLDTTLRFRRPPSHAALTELPFTSFPSWIPDPRAWTSKALEPVISRNNHGRPFPVSAHMSNFKPQISFDGTKLAVTAALFDTVSHCCPILDIVLNIKDCAGAIRVLDWIADTVPRVYHPTGCSGIEALARLIVSAYANPKDPERQWEEDTMARRFCKMLHELIEGVVGDGVKKWNKVLDSLPTWLPTWLKSFPWPSGWAIDYDGIFKAYARIRANHPDAPWPPSNLAGSERKEVIDETRDILPDTLTGISETNITRQESPHFDEQSDSLRDTGDDWNAREFPGDWVLDVLKYNSGIALQSLFLTKEGYLGIGPNWLRNGDGVFLVADAKAPYILAQVDDVLQRQAREIREQLDTGKSRSVKLTNEQRKSLREQLLEIESRPQGESAWQLVGEAYVEGVMNGEAAGLAEAWAQRYDIA